MAHTHNTGFLAWLIALIRKLLGVTPDQAQAASAAADARDTQASGGYPFYRRPFLVTRAELNYYKCLNSVLPVGHCVMSKVRLIDLIDVKNGTGSPKSHTNKIDRKHIDFVLCTQEHLRPMLCIELDDSSHDTEKRKARDTFVKEALAAAGLPFISVRAARTYDTNAMREQLAEILEQTTERIEQRT